MIKWLKNLLAGVEIARLEDRIENYRKECAEGWDNFMKLQEKCEFLKKELDKSKMGFLKLSPVVEWTEKDRSMLKQFLSEGTGARFAAVMRNWTFVANSAATKQPVHSEYFCGKAAGFESAVLKIDELSQVQEVEKQPDNMVDQQLEALGIRHARSNGRSDESLDHLRP